MNTQEPFEPLSATEAEAALAGESSRRLTALLEGEVEVSLQVIEEGKEPAPVPLPKVALRLLARALAQMAQGKIVTLVPVEDELGTQEAADYLNVSEGFLVQMLEQGKIPSRLVAGKPRVLFRDLIRFKQTSSEERKQAILELMAQAQELDLGY